MHMVLLGVVKKILRYWLGFQTKVNEYSRFHKLPSRKRGIMNVRALKMSQSVPVEFQRKPRSFTFIGMFKATEYRSFLCYTAPYVMLALFDYPVVYKCKLHVSCCGYVHTFDSQHDAGRVIVCPKLSCSIC